MAFCVTAAYYGSVEVQCQTATEATAGCGRIAKPMAKILKHEEREIDVRRGESAPAAMDPEYEQLARDLSAIHGTVRITNEASGIHFYMACPTCLEEYGEDELHKMHLAFNAEKYIKAGQSSAAMCMKTEESFHLMDLLAMPPLDQRGHVCTPKVIVKQQADEKYLEPDEHGRMVPKSPGTVVSVYSLPDTHPARMYLASRNFDVDSLTDQFGITYCEQERPDMFYRKLLHGFRATPQGRIVFYIIQDGMVKGWQARILELEHEGKGWYYHPYRKQWVPVTQLVPGQKANPLPGWEEWDPAKYILAHGCARNECLMGFDAAMKYHETSTGPRWAGLVEGPLDAGRVGAPVMATMGKFFSQAQAQIIKDAQFDPVIYIADDDEPGRKAKQSVHKQFDALGISGRLKVIDSPAGYKDLGAMPNQYSAWDYVTKHL